MKTKQLLAVVLLLLLIPISAFAFSCKNLLWWQKPEPQKVDKIQVLSQEERISTEEKFKNWDEAFRIKAWDSLLKNEDQNLTVSEQEVNYMITKQLKNENNPPIKNPIIKFQDNEIILTGYLLKPLEGNIESRFKILSANNQLEIKATKVKYKGIPIPKSLSNKLLNKSLEPIKSFLYSYPDYKGLDVKINNGELKLEYK